jgi:DNA polymerase-4
LLQAWWKAQRHPRLRLLGVSLSGFGERRQEDMFDVSKSHKEADALQDRINERFGSGSLVRAGVLRTRKQD